MISISASVGRLGINRPGDVGRVQELLHRAGMDPGPVDLISGPRTIAAITGYQQRFLSRPDGRVDAGGMTLGRLNGSAVRAAPRRFLSAPSAARTAPAVGVAPRVKPASPAPSPAMTRTSWTGDSEQWPQAKKLASLNADFRRKVERVIQSLRSEGFRPKIVFGWRSVAKQRDLHRRGVTQVLFSFHNAQTPAGVPNALGVDIVDERWAWNEPDCHVFFKALGRLGKAQGLVWGGDWTKFHDWAHLQERQNGELAKVRRESGL